MWYVNNKGADQPAHPRILIIAFVVRCLDSVILIQNFKTYLVSVAEQAGLNLTRLQIPEDRFSRDMAQLFWNLWYPSLHGAMN